MQSEREKALYSKYSQKTYYEPASDSQGIQAMKKSIDSLYKKLNTPHDETEEKIEESQSDPFNLNKDTISTTHPPTQYIHKQNLTSKLNDCTYFSKQSTISQFGQKSCTKKIQKPSTPTFHAQSSLNFLKNRKEQIIRNQAMGLTYDNLQILRKSMSISRLQKSSKKSSLQKQKSNSKDSHLNTHFQKLNSLKKSNDIRHYSKFQRVRSFSQLTKIESILDANDQTSSKRSFLSRSRIKSPNQFHRAKSQTNSLRSSRALSNSSQASKSSTSREIRAVLINSIAGKLDESRFLKDIQVTKQKKMKKQTKIRSNYLEKRLQSLQKILFEIEEKEKRKTIKSDVPLETTKKEVLNNDFLSKLKSEIDNLTEELSELQKWKAKPIINKNPQQENVQITIKTNQTNQNRSRIMTQRTQEPIIQSRSNNHVYTNSGPLSSTLIHQTMQDRPKSHSKITFNYKSTQNGPSIQNFISTTNRNGQINQSTENRCHHFINQSRFPPNNSSNYLIPAASYHVNSFQYPMLNSNFNHLPNQYPTNYFEIQTNSFPHNFHPQNQQYSNQLQMVPQLSYHQNKTISLKNKHAIEAKRHSPLKGNEFHFMANNHTKTTFY